MIKLAQFVWYGLTGRRVLDINAALQRRTPGLAHLQRVYAMGGANNEALRGVIERLGSLTQLSVTVVGGPQVDYSW